MMFEEESPDPLHLEGCLSLGLHICAHISQCSGDQAARGPSRASQVGMGWWDSDSHLPKTSPSCPARPIMRGPQAPPTTRPHTCAAGHAHADLRVPMVQEAGGGGFEYSESRLLPKSIGILSPTPRPPSPAVEVTTAGADTHPPNSLTLGRLLFHNLRQPLKLGDHSPCLPLAPLPLVFSFSCHLLQWRGGLLYLVGVLYPEHWGLPLQWVGKWYPGRR